MIKRSITYHITERCQGLTVAQFLEGQGYSRRLLIHLKKSEQGLMLENRPVHSNHRLISGEVLTVKLMEEVNSANIVPVKLPLTIIYEDKDILVVDKAAGVPVHPSQGNFDNTLANATAWYFKNKGEPFTFRVVNRLDRDTTGLLILAKHMLSACVLSEQMMNRRIQREYRALACGKTPPHGLIDSPIARREGSTIERRVDYERGEPARTNYRLLSYNEDTDLSLLSLKLDTGRTHQIRVHLQSIGHPLPGDFLYNPDYRLIDRQPLHSYALEFDHPVGGNKLRFTSELPEDMKILCNCTSYTRRSPLG